MASLRGSQSHAYSTLEMEDPDMLKHQREQFLIARILEKSDSVSKRSYFRKRACRLKIKIGKQLKRMNKVQLAFSFLTAAVMRMVARQLKHLNDALGRTKHAYGCTAVEVN